jgi:hypothetical protein
VGPVLAVVAVVVMLVVWVLLSHTMGYGASYLVFGDIPLSGPRLEPFLSWRRADAVTQFVFQGAIVLAVLSVRLGLRGRSAAWLAGILTLPWVLFGLLMGVYAVIFGIGAAVNAFNGDGSRSTCTACGSTRWCTPCWRPRRSDTSGAPCWSAGAPAMARDLARRAIARSGP